MSRSANSASFSSNKFLNRGSGRTPSFSGQSAYSTSRNIVPAGLVTKNVPAAPAGVTIPAEVEAAIVRLKAKQNNSLAEPNAAGVKMINDPDYLLVDGYIFKQYELNTPESLQNYNAALNKIGTTFDTNSAIEPGSVRAYLLGSFTNGPMANDAQSGNPSCSAIRAGSVPPLPNQAGYHHCEVSVFIYTPGDTSNLINRINEPTQGNESKAIIYVKDTKGNVNTASSDDIFEAGDVQVLKGFGITDVMIYAIKSNDSAPAAVGTNSYKKLDALKVKQSNVQAIKGRREVLPAGSIPVAPITKSNGNGGNNLIGWLIGILLIILIIAAIIYFVRRKSAY